MGIAVASWNTSFCFFAATLDTSPPAPTESLVGQGVGEGPPPVAFTLLVKMCLQDRKFQDVGHDSQVPWTPPCWLGFLKSGMRKELMGLGQSCPFPGRTHLGLFTGRVPALNWSLVSPSSPWYCGGSRLGASEFCPSPFQLLLGTQLFCEKSEPEAPFLGGSAL